MVTNKENIKDFIEPHIYSLLTEKEYEVFDIASNKLLTYNKLDIAFKLFFLEYHKILPLLAKEVYKADIKAQTMGEFKEFGNEDKDSFDKYIQQFVSTYENIKNYGFDSNKTIIPLAKNNTIFNGSHRVASSIFLSQKVQVANLKLPILEGDYRFYYARGVSEEILELAVLKFIEHCPDNIYLAFLWPSGKGRKKEALSCFSNIVYSKEISLNFNGSFNLLYELYKHMDWIGNKKNSFLGIQQKLTEAFPEQKAFQVVLFNAESLEKVREIKEKVRKIYNIGFSSIHITDTKEESLRIARLLFSENGLHFLNYAKPNKYWSTHQKIKEFKKFLNDKSINEKDIVVDSSMILSLYGIRQSNDIDFITSCGDIDFIEGKIENHENELKFHDEDKNELIYNPKFYFYFDGLKFISFKQLYKMKKNRAEKKDINDCMLMEAFLSDSHSKKFLATLKQKLLFTKVKVRKSIVDIIKFMGVYSFIKKMRDKYVK